MNRDQILKKKADIIGQVFCAANMLQFISDRSFKEDNLTTKQWMLLATIDKFFDDPPGIKDLASRMGLSHQNVKQLALKLEKSGFVKLIKDEEDRRISRVHVTPKVNDVFYARYEKDKKLIELIFEVFNEEEIVNFFDYLNKLIGKLEEVDEKEYLTKV